MDWFRTAPWLHAGRTRGYLRLLALMNLVAMTLLIATSEQGIDAFGHLLGTDFSSFWAAGKLVQDGFSPYDIAAHFAVQRELMPGDTHYAAFFYPPTFALLCLPLAYFGYLPALVIWLIGSGLLFLVALRPWLAELPLRTVLLAVIASPAVLLQIGHGQSTFLVAALLGGGLLMVSRGRSWLGGFLIGLAAIKPQFGILVPVVLLAARNWRAIGGAVLGVVASALSATAVLGSQAWADWMQTGGAARRVMEDGTVGFEKMQSVFAGARLVGLPTVTAYAFQIVAALACAVLLFRVVRKHGMTLAAGGALIAGTLLSTPFVLDYDLVLLGFPMAVLATGGWRPYEKAEFALSFAAPALARGAGALASIPLTVPLTAVLFALLILRARDPQNETGAAFAAPVSV